MSKFEVGQRVRAVGNSQTGEEVDGQFGEVCDIHSPRWVQVRFESGRDLTMHVRNLNRLVPKKPCPPQGGEGKRRVWWLAVGEKSGKISQIDQDTSGSLNGLGPLMLPPCSNQDMPSWVRTVELKPGEILVDYDMLASAMDALAPSVFDGVGGALMKKFCAELGVPYPEGGK